MKQLRLLLYPFAIIYGIITGIRNWLYNKSILKSYAFPLPVIAIGNLSTGGTGKTPMTEYLIRLLGENYRLATLSRGYKRKSKGFVLGSEASGPDILGDEPYQFYSKFPNVRVAVDADRVNGITKLIALTPQPQAIVLDDAYQHRRVKAGFYILLTAYGDLYVDDHILPAGNLRESKTGAERADVILVTKCPAGLSAAEQQRITSKLKLQPGQQVYFTTIAYDRQVYNETVRLNVEDIKHQPKILVAGIAKPEPFFKHLKIDGDILKQYPDHHDFTPDEIQELNNFNQLIITTEKDYMRLRGKVSNDRLYYLPIRTDFLTGSDKFNETIINYVGKSTGNR
ncbi:tetraacyldisaccharide 4'-kinase [Flavobacterium sp. J372]|uniref:tetraacyldisaccharide 4'-kinase n=1 Tax=Flavobacterium sp. J372 TaxID=2898436 RepID=UPI002150C7E9|nr:tetraacyldisaccharide 4'-kinase [Flavobacterium sp. J372]MCR5860900.1 tetraacyldisaccharide 4'-kinase [Flavobacterium sp. J372]